ncbi:ABC transporter ATP-binding protein [Bifidobacterium pullorum subsp. saeculare]|uniref:ABC transporter ATP-binding protein n=1 Tax=Bifidobacterium pullorum subsp. saeculare TaxID=78257 RepID=A0A938WX24_9BIFI|nr:ABC transporter ATP-binding protein [Bifidobacterium pullorum]MBM6699247.1 ABC transporter ATP-binding protein [Bifidobacterium pullorum subsp. saeculare]
MAEQPALSLDGATKDYGHGRGVFDEQLDVDQGSVVGFLGANGAGKTVTMRMLMGFIRPDRGAACIAGLDCFRDRAAVQTRVGYLPGEVSCPTDMTGIAFLNFMTALRADGAHVAHGRRAVEARMGELIDRFDLDPSARIGRMSKGTRQKVAIVAAFMGSPDVLLLDEPTSGLDPLMQERFVELVREERARGATVFLSSHMFPEVERTCDRVAFLKAGHIVGVEDMAAVRAARARTFLITFADAAEAGRYRAAHPEATVPAAEGTGREIVTSHDVAANMSLTVRVSGTVSGFVKDLAEYRVADLASREQSLEDMFLHLYGDRETGGGGTNGMTGALTGKEDAR